MRPTEPMGHKGRLHRRRVHQRSLREVQHSFKGSTGSPINGVMHFYDPQQKCLKIIILINTGPRWAWQNLWGYGRMILSKF